MLARSLLRASISSPRKGSFFRPRCDAHICDHSGMMIGDAQSVNVGITTQRVTLRCRKKKPGSKEPGLRYWPREADTITFQEGLLSFRATGGGGHMRNANAQRGTIMIRLGVLQQPPAPHVSHAEIGGRCHESEVRSCTRAKSAKALLIRHAGKANSGRPALRLA